MLVMIKQNGLLIKRLFGMLGDVLTIILVAVCGFMVDFVLHIKKLITKS